MRLSSPPRLSISAADRSRQTRDTNRSEYPPGQKSDLASRKTPAISVAPTEYSRAAHPSARSENAVFRLPRNPAGQRNGRWQTSPGLTDTENRQKTFSRVTANTRSDRPDPLPRLGGNKTCDRQTQRTRMPERRKIYPHKNIPVRMTSDRDGIVHRICRPAAFSQMLRRPGRLSSVPAATAAGGTGNQFFAPSSSMRQSLASGAAAKTIFNPFSIHSRPVASRASPVSISVTR